MSDIIKMDYGLMEEMSQTFLQAVEALQDTTQEIQSIANTLEGGALLGRGGTGFVESLRGDLTPAIARLIDKCQELSQDINSAVESMQAEDSVSDQLFKD